MCGRTNSRVWKVIWALMLLSVPARLETAEQNPRPNILIMTADNLGYGDLSCFNAQSPVISPNLNRLAKQGARLTQFYTASPTCTVSRACLLTGRIPQRHGLNVQLPGIQGNYGVGLDQKEVLISEVLRKSGYATGCFGKWNIGFAEGSRPTERGFDEFLGHASGNIDYYTHNYNGKHDLFRGIQPAYLKGYATDLFADAAIAFIERQTELQKPWFCYLPFNAPHFPNPKNKKPDEPCIWQAPKSAFEAYGYDHASNDEKQRYHAVITALDAAIGRVLNRLDALELTKHTFVFFYSDNGAFMLKRRGLEVASNFPLRDGGVTCWEGGIRVAAIARWPGHITSDQTMDQSLWSPDLFPACTELASADLPARIRFDGRNPLPVLTGKAQVSPHKSFYFQFGQHAALRMGDWKIVRARPDEAWSLFDLTKDVGEENNLAEQHPNRLEQLVRELGRWESGF